MMMTYLIKFVAVIFEIVVINVNFKEIIGNIFHQFSASTSPSIILGTGPVIILFLFFFCFSCFACPRAFPTFIFAFNMYKCIKYSYNIFFPRQLNCTQLTTSAVLRILYTRSLNRILIGYRQKIIINIVIKLEEINLVLIVRKRYNFSIMSIFNHFKMEIFREHRMCVSQINEPKIIT